MSSENGLVVAQPTPLSMPSHQSFLEPTRFAQAMQVAAQIAKTELVPKQFRDNPAAIVVAWEMGGELGLSPMASLQNIAVINGLPSVWGDSLPAICMRHPQWGGMVEEMNPAGTEATCTVIRRDAPANIVRSFSMDDAKTAGLSGKEGPWRSYPKRMLQMRARAFALRDAFPDALRGMHVAEEIIDATEPLGVVAGVSASSSVGDVLDFISRAKTEAELAPVILWVEGRPDDVRDVVRSAYASRTNELRKPPEGRASFGRTKKSPPTKPAETVDAKTGEVTEAKAPADKPANDAATNNKAGL